MDHGHNYHEPGEHHEGHRWHATPAQMTAKRCDTDKRRRAQRRRSGRMDDLFGKTLGLDPNSRPAAAETERTRAFDADNFTITIESTARGPARLASVP
jgi:hypothetical protein